MNQPPSLSIDDKSWRAPVWCLRITIALQSLGTAWWFLFHEYEHESPVHDVLYFEWAWPASRAQSVDDWGNWLYLVCGVSVLVLPLIGRFRAGADGSNRRGLASWTWQGLLLAYVSLWQLMLACAALYRGGHFMSEWSLGAQAVRILAPVGLLLLLLPSRNLAISLPQMTRAIFCLRVGAAATFVTHGLQALLHGPSFADLIIGSAQNLVGWKISQPAAEWLLTAIGCIDIAAALALVLFRWRFVAVYMAVWGGIAAFSRITAWGWLFYPDTLLRASNCGVALAILLYWHYATMLRPSVDATGGTDGKPTN